MGMSGVIEPKRPAIEGAIDDPKLRNNHLVITTRDMNSGAVASSSTPRPPVVPRVGGVRCYWSLLTPLFPDPAVSGSKLELVFVHPDPVLSTHLAKQKINFLGRGVIEFIHPAEREQARRDLANAIASDDLQGSVTRMRYARLSRVRKVLGCAPEDVDIPYDASTFVEDDEYLILDLVLNWVADGILLAFFHAIRDKDPAGNNDPRRQNEEWSNFCGTGNMGEDQIEALHINVSSQIPLPPPSRFPPTRIFQLHTTAKSPTRPNSLVFSWPPPRPHGLLSKFDGLYETEEYSDLMRGVDMDPSQLATGPDEMRTNCTTRFGAKHSITSEGTYRHVTSVFIPYGTLVFSCFQNTKQVELSPRSPGSYALMTPQQEWSIRPASEWPRSSPFMKRDREEYEEQHIESMPYPAHPPPQTHHVPEAVYPTPASHASDMYGDVKSPGGTTSRPLVRPPGDVECCRMCGLHESPEWRRSETGVKDLCNACGLRLARQVAKREGRQKPRKKKD